MSPSSVYCCIVCFCCDGLNRPIDVAGAGGLYRPIIDVGSAGGIPASQAFVAKSTLIALLPSTFLLAGLLVD